MIPNNIDAARKVIEEDWYVTNLEIETFFDISQTAIHSIKQEHLAVKRLVSDGFRTVLKKHKKRLILD